ncbi:protein-cysteine N-palmitoyltransferase HHAT-like protein isoform X2 [Lontra canadensis]|uniref:protein-cysteine N-palmitoyltransferase HHAT-like protein isoform X2 n=1 Tax=Lontra canadensis TaxID=76717 RepID=UPI0013F36A89|nr:protein-cysteine N-palmitoyltransferase HHAT-like protein isoform X2 [Lontra canadensis]
MGIKTALPAAELGLYSLVLSGALAYAGRGLLEASQDGAHRKAFRESVRPGWEYIGRKMDVADFEWVMWFTSFRNVIVFALSGHVLFAKLCTMVAPQSGLVTGTFDLQEVLFHGGSGFTVLRCASFALESCAHPDRRYSLADLLKYNFYLPFFFFGPIMTFDRFHTQMSQVEPVRREGELWCIRAQAGLSVVAIMAVDIFFHFFYILTIPSDLKFANRLPDSALAGLAYSNLVYDWVKAAVLFGVVNTVARLDHLDPPQAPKCITALYVFAETHFDRGINDWLCKYVYDHIGGEHSEVIPELGATVATFAITTLWLGPCDIVYLWSFLNCFGLNFELWAQKLAEWGPLAQIEVSGKCWGQGLAESLEGVALLLSGIFQPHVEFLKSSQSRTFSPRLPGYQGNGSPCGYLAPLSVECGHLGQAGWSVFPSLTMREGCPGDSQGPKLNPRTWGSHEGRVSDPPCPLSPGPLADAFLNWAGFSVGADVSQGPSSLWGRELLGHHHVQPCKPEQP